MSISLRRPSGPPDVADQKPSKQPKQPKQPKRASRPKPTTSSASSKTAAPPTTTAVEGLTVGGDPRVDLLPPEVRSARRDARTRRGFTWGVLAVFLVVVVASATAFGFNLMAQTQLFAAQARTNDLLAQQQKYVEVRTVQNQVDVAVAAQQVGDSTEVAWEPFIRAIGKAEPAGLKMKSITVDAASPIAVFQQSTDPLQGPRIATVTVVTLSDGFPDVPGWVAAVQKLTGVVDVSAGTVNRDETGIYTSSVVIHVGDGLYTNRFQTKDK